MKKIFFISIAFLLIIVSGCKNDINNQELSDNTDIHVFMPRMDVSDAKALFYIEYGGGEYYKITNDNKIEPVKPVNTDGTTIYDNPINGTFAGFGFLTGSNFIFADITNSILWNENGQMESYSFDKPRAIEKRTGKMFKLSQNGFSVCSDRQYPYKNEREIQSSNDNFFYKSGRMVFKINSTLSSEQYSPSGKEISFFRVDSKNNMVYIDFDGEYVLKRHSGQLVSLSDMEAGDIGFFWLGSDDNFYLYKYDYQSQKHILDKLTITDTGQTITTIIDDITNDFYPNFYSFKINFEGAELFISSNISVGNKNYIYYENTQTLSDKTSFFPTYEELEDVDQSLSTFYLQTKNNIIKFDFDLQYTELFNSNEYDFYAMTVDKNDNVLFNALRNSDGKAVFGLIDSSGTISIINDTFNKRAYCLEFL